MNYRWHTGYVAWLLNRITGIAVLAYLIAHIWVVHHLGRGPRAFGEVMRVLSQPIFTLFEIALIGAVLYHTLNGIRVVLVDFGGSVRTQKRTFWVMMAIGVVLFVIAVWEMVGVLFAPVHTALIP